MRIGLITEGLPDQAVIENILNSKIDDYSWSPIRPINLVDETDIYIKNNAAVGGISRIKKDCEEKKLFEEFFELEIGGRKNVMIIQLDTAEVDNFNIVRPTKKRNKDYVQELRTNVIEKIQEWLDDDSYDENLVYAISVEELEAWLLTIFESKNSISSMDPKSKLKRILRPKKLSTAETFENYSSLSKPFKKKNELAKCAKNNESLQLFIDDLEKQIEIEA